MFVGSGGIDWFWFDVLVLIYWLVRWVCVVGLLCWVCGFSFGVSLGYLGLVPSRILWVDCLLALGLRVLGGLGLFWVSLVAGCASGCCGGWFVCLVCWFDVVWFCLFSG